MKKLLLLIFIIVSGFNNCFAQYNSNRNKTWAFGYKAGLDFTSGSPVPIVTALDTNIGSEGVASVCDAAGHLLFYSHGVRVFNRNHVLMPHGNSIAPFFTHSTSQAALIAPVIGTSNKYYLFSLQQTTIADAAMCHLVYCIVDLTLDGGFGDVVTSTINTPIADSLGERMIAITGNNHNIWLVTHMKDTALFLTYEITSTGISTTPIVSATGRFTSLYGYMIGCLTASHDRHKIVSNTVYQNNPFVLQKYGTELYDFDPASGFVSNCIVLDSMNSHYGAEFSPDNTKLYTDQQVTSDTAKIFQYNLSLSTPNLIRASKTQIAVIAKSNLAPLKLGPDNKIYFISTDTFSSPYSRYMDCITSPNSMGTSCGYVYRAITMASGTGMQFGLPNVYVTEDTNATTFLGEVSSAEDVSIFPNPATDEVSIISPVTINHISILNLVGNEIYNMKYNSKMAKLDVSTLPSGMYFVIVNGQTNRRFLKE